MKSQTNGQRDQVFNGLDCCVTAEVLDVLLPQLDNHTTATYSFSKSLRVQHLRCACGEYELTLLEKPR